MPRILEARIRIRTMGIWSTFWQGHVLECEREMSEVFVRMQNGEIDEFNVTLVFPTQDVEGHPNFKGWEYVTQSGTDGSSD